MIYPTLEEAKKYIDDYARIPLVYELLADTYTPINVFQKFMATSKNCFLLESAENAEQWGRYSFIGFDPLQEIRIKNSEITVIHRGGITETILSDDPLSFVDRLAERYKSPRLPNMPHLTGGLVGYFGYDTIRYIEKQLTSHPKVDLMLHKCYLFL